MHRRALRHHQSRRRQGAHNPATLLPATLQPCNGTGLSPHLPHPLASSPRLRSAASIRSTRFSRRCPTCPPPPPRAPTLGACASTMCASGARRSVSLPLCLPASVCLSLSFSLTPPPSRIFFLLRAYRPPSRPVITTPRSPLADPLPGIKARPRDHASAAGARLAHAKRAPAI